MNDIIETAYRPEPRRYRTEPSDEFASSTPRKSLHADIQNVYQHHLNLKAEMEAFADELGADSGRKENKINKFDKSIAELVTQVEGLRSELALVRAMLIALTHAHGAADEKHAY